MPIVQYHGRGWYINKGKKGGAQAEMLENNVLDEPNVYLEIWHKKQRHYGVMPAEDVAMFVMFNRNAFEIMPINRRRKFYMDYDVVVTDTDQTAEEHDRVLLELQAKVVADAESVCGPGRAVLSGSWGKKDGKIKYSLHVIRPDRFFRDHAAALAMPTIAARLGADSEVYNRNQHFKLPWQTKVDDTRVQNLITGAFVDHLVTAGFDADAVELNLPIPVPKPRKEPRGKKAKTDASPAPSSIAPWPVGEGQTPPLVPDNWAMTAPPLETLALVRHSRERPIPRNARYMIMGWCWHRHLRLEDFLAWVFRGKEETPERRARYARQWDEWEHKRAPGDKRLLLVLGALYPDVILTNENARIYRETHSLVTTRTVKGGQGADGQLTLHEVFEGPKFLGVSDFGTERAALLHIPMGKGKTTQIRGILQRGGRCLIVTHRQTLAADIYANCKESAKQLQHYIIDFPDKQAKMYMGVTNQLIIQLESIHYLRGADPYEYVMIDESQLLFMQAASGTLGTPAEVKLMWETLTDHIKKAKYVRFYDGFMGRITMDVLKGLGIHGAAVVRMPTSIPNNNRTMYIKSVANTEKQTEWLKKWALEIGTEVARGKNVMVFYPFKRENAYWLDMHQILSLICSAGGIDEAKDTVKHFGEMDGKEKARILSGINLHWKKRVVLTNAAVTAGLDFNEDWFHRSYACVSGNQNPREVIQWLSRARKLKENEVYIVTISPRIKPMMIKDSIGTDPVYKNLIANCNTELQNSCRTTLECFAIDAGYKIKADKPGFSTRVMQLAESTQLQHDLGMKYENIEAISPNKAEFLRQKVTSQAATTKEMICLDKYYFDRLFLDEVDEDQRGDFWNGGLTRAAHAIREYRKPNCQIRAQLPGLASRIDDILAGASVSDPAEVVKAAFDGNPKPRLDQATFRAIEARYPKHQRNTTSDQKVINMLMNDVCNTDIWRYNHKNGEFDVNKKLKDMSELFASIRSDSGIFEEQPKPECLFLPTGDCEGEPDEPYEGTAIDDYEAISGDEA